jgi:hypothetical protein
VFVGGLNFQTEPDVLEDHFSKFGRLRKAEVGCDTFLCRFSIVQHFRRLLKHARGCVCNCAVGSETMLLWRRSSGIQMAGPRVLDSCTTRRRAAQQMP